MRLVLQRVAHASVTIDGEVVGKIDKGILALVGMNTGDDESVFERMFNKITKLRIFEDSEDKMNLSVTDLDYGVLLVPNFTIYADARRVIALALLWVLSLMRQGKVSITL